MRSFVRGVLDFSLLVVAATIAMVDTGYMPGGFQRTAHAVLGTCPKGPCPATCGYVNRTVTDTCVTAALATFGKCTGYCGICFSGNVCSGTTKSLKAACNCGTGC